MHTPATDSKVRLKIAAMLMGGIVLAGTLGYHFMYGLVWLDALYMTVITISSVGFGEIGGPYGPGGRVFTAGLILSSMAAVAFSATSFVTFIVEGELQKALRGRRMDKQISGLREHFVVCGTGPIGHAVVEEFIKTGNRFVVVGTNRDAIEHNFPWPDLLFLVGDPTEDWTLKAAGVERARGLLAVMDEDKDNMIVVLSARSLNPNLRIIARAVEEVHVSKLKKAGADEVVLTAKISGMRLASTMLRPSVVTFLDKMLYMDGALRMEEANIEAGSAMVGVSLRQARINERTGVLVVAIRDEAGAYHFNPPADAPLEPGSTLVVMAHAENLGKLRMLGKAGAPAETTPG